MALANNESTTSAVERRSQPVLLLGNTKDSSQRIQRFALEKFNLSIGRSPDDDISLSEGSGVSRHHASVFVLDGEVVIQDLGSRNGTYVNKKLIPGNRQTTLKFGDVIMIGRYRLKLVDETASRNVNAIVEVHELLRRWHVAAVAPVSKPCALCHLEREVPTQVAFEAQEVMEPTATVECVTASASQIIVDFDLPAHGRRFDRNLPRRPALKKQRLPARRAARLTLRRPGVPVRTLAPDPG